MQKKALVKKGSTNKKAGVTGKTAGKSTKKGSLVGRDTSLTDQATVPSISYIK